MHEDSKDKNISQYWIMHFVVPPGSEESPIYTGKRESYMQYFIV